MEVSREDGLGVQGLKDRISGAQVSREGVIGLQRG